MVRIPSAVQDLLRKRIYHEQKIILLNKLVEGQEQHSIVHDFIRAEELLIKKKGFAAARVYEEIAVQAGEPRWLLDRLARTLAKYAYQDIGSGPIEKSHAIFTQKLGEDPEKAWKKIADILKRMKGWGYAAQCYANAGMAGTAARMFEKQLKDGQRAAFYYEENEEFVRAARMYKKAKLYDKAGECYAKGGLLKNAVQLWKKAGTLEKHNIGEQTLARIMGR
ncbi:hypothetical protein KY362_02970 [Candidatus Woesearchaeota archaeon]|nr:hypothetical protein [Candidatus Woesearchaeota archaeon]